MKTRTIALTDLHPDPLNARQHNPRNIGMIADSIGAVGVSRSGVIDEDGTILAGNGTFEALTQRGIKKVQVIETDGEEWVVVQRSGLTDKQKRQLSITDNRASDLATWDGALLQAQDVDLTVFWDENELRALRMEEEQGTQTNEEDAPPIDHAVELQVQYGTAVGQVWGLGDHRLVCGDCTSDILKVLREKETIDLVWTDPPYGVSYGDKNQFLNAIGRGNRIQKLIANDHGSEMDTELLCRTALAQAVAHATAGACAYVAIPSRLQRRFIDAFNASGFTYKHQLIWVKNQFVFGRSDYHYRHEPILYGWKENGPHYWNGGHAQDSIFEIDKPHVSDVHPTMKPVRLVEKMIQNSSRPGGIVYDPFLGSGTTLIACENLTRHCRGIEIDPGYVAVTLQRWATLTGQEPILLQDTSS
jgi:DNA modification methylase